MKEIFKILLVDDIEENLYALENLLEADDRQILKASSGNEGLKIALSDSPGLIISDVQMPEMDGFEMVNLLKSNPRTSGITVLFVTAISREDEHTIRGLSEGAIDYLTKPINSKIMLAKVKVYQDLYEATRNLATTNEKLDKLNGKLKDFAHIVAHDLKSPLVGMHGLIQVIQEDIEGQVDDDRMQDLQMLEDRATKLINMIHGVLEYSKATSVAGRPEPTNIFELVQEIFEAIPNHSNAKMDNSVATGMFNVEFLQLSRVLSNLMSNAVKYGARENGTVQVAMAAKEDELFFEVSDNGAGIPENQLDKIFTIFSVAHKDKSIDSTGVGLAIVKKIIEDIGGEIEVTSTVGVGTKFSFKWPIASK